MPYVRIWIHLIWSTKNRKKIISKKVQSLLLQHILQNAKNKNIYIDQINFVQDHYHYLISLRASQSISKVAFLLKGESSHWVNKDNLSIGKFEWQDEYIALSVSESQVPVMSKYIKHQEEHHRNRTFTEEYDLFLKKYGFEYSG